MHANEGSLLGRRGRWSRWMLGIGVGLALGAAMMAGCKVRPGASPGARDSRTEPEDADGAPDVSSGMPHVLSGPEDAEDHAPRTESAA